MNPIRIYDNTIWLFCPNRQYCEWAAALFRLGARPTTPSMQTVYDLMLAGF